MLSTSVKQNQTNMTVLFLLSYRYYGLTVLVDVNVTYTIHYKVHMWSGWRLFRSVGWDFGERIRIERYWSFHHSNGIYTEECYHS